jgi:hypothetical protein
MFIEIIGLEEKNAELIIANENCAKRKRKKRVKITVCVDSVMNYGLHYTVLLG